MAKFDTATTRSIELLPSEAKDKMFNLVVKNKSNKSLDVVEEFLKGLTLPTNEFGGFSVHHRNQCSCSLKALPEPDYFFSLGRQKFYPATYLLEPPTFGFKEPVPENTDGTFSLSVCYPAYWFKYSTKF